VVLGPWVWVLPLVAMAVVHHAGPGSGFAADDLDFLARAMGRDEAAWPLARPLPGQWRWTLLTAWFGAQPAPHLWLAFLSHAASTLLVTAIARILTGRDAVAATAGVLFGAAAIAYAPLHWASGLGETLATSFVLAAFALHLRARQVHAPALAWLAGACAVLAVLSKESSLLAPVVVALADRLCPVRGEGRGAVREVALLGGLAGAAAIAAYVASPHVGGEAYAIAWNPAVWVRNLGTYLAWTVQLADPVRDRVATASPSHLPVAAAVAAALALLAWLERRDPLRPVRTGMAWALLLLAPVLLLERQAYLYYLLLPWAGLVWAAAAALGRLADRVAGAGAGAAGLLAVVAVGFTANESLQLHARRTLAVNGMKVDRIAREGELVRNGIGGLRRAAVAAGDTVLFVNPFPPLSMDASRGTVRGEDAAVSRFAYIPFVAAMRQGAVVPLFLPGVSVRGCRDAVLPEDERARVFQFDNDGTLTELGRGADALLALSEAYLIGERWGHAQRTLERLIVLGHDSDEVRWRLGRAFGMQGDDAGALREAQELLRRWPDSPRARALRENAARAGIGDPLRAPAPPAR
jgi:hypothetical protein